MKECTTCKQVKPTTEFNKRSASKDGLKPCCRECDNAYSAAWKLANKERHIAGSNAWNSANPEQHKKHIAKWRQANRERERVTASRWRIANLERLKVERSIWWKANRDLARIYKNNRRSRIMASGGVLSRGLASKLFLLQKGKCACGCKQPLGDDFHLDHRMPLALGGTNTDDNMQLLTATCNLQKGAKHPVEFMQQRGLLL